MAFITELPSVAHIVLLLVSTGALVVGATYLVDGASRLGQTLGLSDLTIGLMIVGFGTSAPEMVISAGAAMEGRGAVALGNVVGSNVFNLGFILGICAILGRIPTCRTIVRRDGTMVIIAYASLFLLTAMDMQLGAFDGAVLLLGLFAYLTYVARTDRERITGEVENPSADGSAATSAVVVTIWPHLGKTVAGIATLVLGGELMVASASELALRAGMSEWAVGVTIIAAGTSAPELASSIAAVIRGKGSMAIGALLGSDIFNILGVLGVASLISPIDLDAHFRLSILLMGGTVLLAVAAMRRGWRLVRWEGLALLLFACGRWGFDLVASPT